MIKLQRHKCEGGLSLKADLEVPRVDDNLLELCKHQFELLRKLLWGWRISEFDGLDQGL